MLKELRLKGSFLAKSFSLQLHVAMLSSSSYMYMNGTKGVFWKGLASPISEFLVRFVLLRSIIEHH